MRNKQGFISHIQGFHIFIEMSHKLKVNKVIKTYVNYKLRKSLVFLAFIPIKIRLKLSEHQK